MPASTPESLARLFHETYERLAPAHGYETREASAVPWEDVPAANKSLMTAVAGELLPMIERDLREQIAAAIEAERSGGTEHWVMAMDHAARIARGEA